jgi:hypothetical protein
VVKRARLVHGRRHGGMGGARLPAGLPAARRRDPVSVSPRRIPGRQRAARRAAREHESGSCAGRSPRAGS